MRLSAAAAAFASALAALAACAPPAHAASAPPEEKHAVEITALKPHLKLIHDGKGHYLAILPREAKVDSPHGAVLYGDDAELYFLRQISSSASPGAFSYSFWDPRVPQPGVELLFAQGRYTVRCGKTEVRFTELAPDARKALLDKVRAYEARWQRTAYALARDERGSYYFVDRSSREDRKRDFRLFVGKVGQLKPQQMKNIVSDSEGDIFSTPRGTLRLVLGKEEAVWISGKRRTKLLPLPLWPNRALIYNDLGVYAGQRLGTPCDDL